MILIVGKVCIIACSINQLIHMKKIILLLILTLFITSCSNEGTETKDENNINEGKYFAIGSKYGRNKDNNFSQLASIWVDGVPTTLSNTGTSVADAVAFYNNDLYIAGTESLANGNQILKLWKNNTSQNLTNGNHHVEATDIAVNKENVYISGNEFSGSLNSSIATVWKNGQTIHLTDQISEANAIYIHNNDIYVTGYKVIDDKITAVVWKNGIETVLYSEDNDLESIATDIYVDNENVYITGCLRNSVKSAAVLWKNKVITTLSDADNYSETRALFVYNSDVYVIGCDINTHDYDFVGKIWKNGTLVKEINNANPECITIKNHKIYIAGSGLDDRGMNQEGKIWESDLNNLDFVEKYKFPNDEIKAVLIK